MQNTDSSLGNKAVSASKWSVLAEIASRAISPVVFLVLARLLSPNDYGVAATAALVISFSQVIWEAGLAKSLIQKEAKGFDLYGAATSVFWANLALATLVYVIIVACAPWLAALFKDPRITLVIRVQGFQVIIAAFSSVQTSLFQRKLNYKPLFWVRFITVGLPGLASIPLALNGFGYWALVIGAMLGAFGQSVTLWILSDWKPSFSFSMILIRAQARYGMLAFSEGLVGWTYMWLDNFIIAKCISIQMLGVYRTGAQITGIAFTLILDPLLSVLFATLSRIQFEAERYQRIFLTSIKFIASFAFCVAILLFLFAHQIETLVFGSKWVGISVVIQAMAFQQGITWMVALNAVSYRAKGRPDINAKLMILAILFYSPIYYYTSAQSFQMFIIARALVPIPIVALHFYLNQRYCGLRMVDHLKTVYFKLMVFLTVVIADLLLVHWTFWGQSIFVSIALSMVSLSLILFSERDYLRTEVLPKLQSVLRPAAIVENE